MPRSPRFARYIQDLAYQSLFQHAERDERPHDAPPRCPEQSPSDADWNVASFTGYVPFRSPSNS